MDTIVFFHKKHQISKRANTKRSIESTQYRNSEARIRYVSITLPYILEIDVGMDTYSAVMRNLGNTSLPRPLYFHGIHFQVNILRDVQESGGLGI